VPVLESKGLPATIFVVTDRVGSMGAFWPDEISRRIAESSMEERRSLAEGMGLAAVDGSTHALLTELKLMPEIARADAIDQLREVTTDPIGKVRELLDWDELTNLSRRGVDIESHGVSHAILTRTSAEITRKELNVALQSLRDRGHGRHALLAYPSGAFDEQVVRLAREAGYAGAVTTETGIVTRECDPLMLPRIGLHEDISGTRSEFLRWVPGMAVGD
jgi:peptidoglycan/xylan/chitin deacetylase (PgdA/CDA1 family)